MTSATRRLGIFCLLSVAVLLIGCSTTLDDYSETSPQFNLKDFFSGEMRGWGIVTNFRGKVIQRFTVDMHAAWNDQDGELYELFKFQNGTTQERTWFLSQRNDQLSIGTASDVIGEARGQQNGFAFFWEYDLLINNNDKKLKVHLEDWIYQIDSNSLVSKGKISKFGIPVGEVIVFILKQETS